MAIVSSRILRNTLMAGAAALALSGCIPVIFAGGAATGGTIGTDARTSGGIVDDTTIKLRINNNFARKNFGDLFRNVSSSVTEGRVMLTGDVDKPETKTAAAEETWKVKGVKEVINEIQINDQSGVTDYARDSWIANQIRSKILLEKGVRSQNYKIEVVNGIVYLMGIAQDQDELNKVTYLSSTTSHVKEVVSHVIFFNDPRRHVDVPQPVNQDHSQNHDDDNDAQRPVNQDGPQGGHVGESDIPPPSSGIQH